MSAILLFKGGPERGREFRLPTNESVKFGSALSADVTVVGDPLLDAEHFVIEPTPESQYRIRNLAPQRPVRLNGRPVRVALLKSGDVIQAGLTALQFRLAQTPSQETRPGHLATEASSGGPLEQAGVESLTPDPNPSGTNGSGAEQQAEARLELAETIDAVGYSLAETIGEGTYGQVFKAIRHRDRKPIAIKLIHPSVAVLPRQRELFLREIRVHRALDHPHITSFLFAGQPEHRVTWFAMEFSPGRTLHEIALAADSMMSVSDACAITIQILSALDYAHNVPPPAGPFVHRDVKPKNILVAGTPGAYRAKLTDFGTAKCFENAGATGYTRTGDMRGTLEFMAPEQLIDSKYAGPEVDVFAAGAVLYACLAGQIMYPAETRTPPSKLVQNILEREIVPIRDHRPDLPESVVQVINRAVGLDAVRRFHSARQMEAALAHALDGRDIADPSQRDF